MFSICEIVETHLDQYVIRFAGCGGTLQVKEQKKSAGVPNIVKNYFRYRVVFLTNCQTFLPTDVGTKGSLFHALGNRYAPTTRRSPVFSSTTMLSGPRYASIFCKKEKEIQTVNE